MYAKAAKRYYVYIYVYVYMYIYIYEMRVALYTRTIIIRRARGKKKEPKKRLTYFKSRIVRARLSVLTRV